MNCTILLKGDYARVMSDEREGGLSLDFSSSYCRLFESTKSQGRDYMKSIRDWCGDAPDNSETLMRSLTLYITTLRREMGLNC